MAEENSDLFLTLITPSGDVVGGETQDEAMAESGMEISEFEVSFGKTAVRASDNKFQDALRELQSVQGGERIAELFKKQRDILRWEIYESQSEIQKLKDEGKISTEMSQSFTIKKSIDTASPALMRAYHASCVNKTYLFKYAIVSSFRAGGAQNPYFVATFSNVRMISYKISMSMPSPTEDLDFAFGQCLLEYSQQAVEGDHGSPASFAWDFVQGSYWNNAPENMVRAR